MVFAWARDDDPNVDLYIREVDGGRALRRLTNGPGRTERSAWSPDGRWIAFHRGAAVFLISPLGGTERQLATTTGEHLAWTPDGAELLLTQRGQDGNVLVAVKVATGETRQVMSGKEQLDIVQPFGISDDGKLLVYTRWVLGGTSAHESPSDLFVRGAAGGESRSLTRSGATLRGWTWIPGTHEVVLCSDKNGEFQLWRVNADRPDRAPALVEGAGGACGYPSAARYRAGPGSPQSIVLACERRDFVVNLSVFDVSSQGAEPRIERILSSTRMDSSPAFSPDGRKLVFVSNRSGFSELWTATAPGADPTQLNACGASRCELETPVWSPDGSEILFVEEGSGQRAFYVISAGGGQPRRVWTAYPGDRNPDWSRDGRYVYFASARGGRWQIWKAAYDRAAGKLELPGAPITTDGFDAHESADGRDLFYVKDPGMRSLWSIPADGKPHAPTKVIASGVYRNWWRPTPQAILFLEQPNGQPYMRKDIVRSIDSFDLHTKRITTVARVKGRLFEILPNFAVSPDGDRVVFGHVEYENIDIALLRNFR